MHRRSGQTITREEILDLLLDKAKMGLEAQALTEFSDGRAPSKIFQPIELEEMGKASFQILALRKTWKARWTEVRAKASHKELQSFLEALIYSPLADLDADDL